MRPILKASVGLSVCAAALASAVLAGSALSAPTPGSAAPSASAREVPVAPPLPVLGGAELPEAASAPPAESEWASAPEVGASRGALSSNCKARLVREWLRVTCTRSPGVGLVAGDPALVKLRSGFTESPLEMTSIADMAVRRGTSAIVSFVSANIGTTSVTTAEGQLVQVGWREGAPHPLFVAYAAHQAK